LVGEEEEVGGGGGGGGSGSLRSIPKYALLSTQTHKGPLPNKNTLFLISSCAKHTPPKPKDTGYRERERERETLAMGTALFSVNVNNRLTQG